MVVGPDVEVAGRRIQPHALELADDGLVVRPTAGQLVGLLDRALEQVERRIPAIGLEARILVPTLEIALDERGVDRPLVARRIREVIVGVHPGQDARGMVRADGVGFPAEGEGGGDLHLVEQPVTEGLLVERRVVSSPQANDQDVGLGGKQLRDMGREVGREQLRPRLGDDLGPRHEPLERQHEVLVDVPAVAVVRLDGRDLLCLRPRLRRADRGRDAVRRLDVGHPEDVVRVGNRLVEQEIRAPVVEQRQYPELFGHRAEGRGVAAGDDAGEHVDSLRQLHPPEFLDVGIGAGGFVGHDRLDLPLAQQPAFGVDLLGGQQVPFPTGFAQSRGGTCLERDVAGLERLVGDIPFHLGGRVGLSRAGEVGCRPGRRHKAGGADGDAQSAQEIPAFDLFFL